MSRKLSKFLKHLTVIRGMQDCFREHPDIYGAELEPDDEDDEPGAPVKEGGEAEEVPSSTLEITKPKEESRKEMKDESKEKPEIADAPGPLERPSK